MDMDGELFIRGGIDTVDIRQPGLIEGTDFPVIIVDKKDRFPEKGRQDHSMEPCSIDGLVLTDELNPPGKHLLPVDMMISAVIQGFQKRRKAGDSLPALIIGIDGIDQAFLLRERRYRGPVFHLSA